MDDHAQGHAILLITDIDGTLIGDDDALARLNELWLTLMKPQGSKLVYNTGRSVESFVRLVRRSEGLVMLPDLYICNNGTTICSWPDGIDEPAVYDTSWSERLQGGGWEKARVKAAAIAAAVACGFAADIQVMPEPKGNASSRAMIDALGQWGIREGRSDKGLAGAFKYNLVLNTAGSPEQRDTDLKAFSKAFQSELTKANAGSIHVDTSWLYATPHSGPPSPEDWGMVDAMPAAGGKGNATTFVRKAMGFPEERTVVAGDSGNDIAMFEAGKERGVIVGNAEGTIREWYQQSSSSCTYFASTFSAGGIMEGLRHFGFAPVSAKL
jgi:hydroxymethylpyrimidine pyrophosphatase-like HAD family hydrolase